MRYPTPGRKATDDLVEELNGESRDPVIIWLKKPMIKGRELTNVDAYGVVYETSDDDEFNIICDIAEFIYRNSVKSANRKAIPGYNTSKRKDLDLYFTSLSVKLKRQLAAKFGKCPYLEDLNQADGVLFNLYCLNLEGT